MSECLEATGEPLELMVEILREVIQVRKTRDWLYESFGIDLAVTPETFDILLEIPQINLIETPNRSLEMEVVSIRETRNPGSPVTVGNLNSVLRAFYQSLLELKEKKQRKFPDLVLAPEMFPNLVEQTESFVRSLRNVNGGFSGFFLKGWKFRKLENEFRTLFPNSPRAHPLGKTVHQIERELEFYRSCMEVDKKWEAIQLDLFRVLREEGLLRILENVEELGTRLWNIVYKNIKVKRSMEIVGFDFGDIRSLFEGDWIALRNV